ncbi:alpha/beta fold hydrolase [Actinoplanes solisilvae]|uniref:alpha/beta fold hydrolase n=1 Tax=Actinoplanes solisilvae TaxID=2486853 RepID=UPI000FDCB97D|nr:alpha/beta hydrolase [Actinoplanes solisilvae]
MLFVHGWAGDSHDWGWQLAHFTARTRVIAVDLRGHGSSTVTDGGYEARTFAADIAALLRSLCVPPVIAVGHSLGGLVVEALAVEHAELVRAVVPVEPSYGYGDLHARPLIELAERITEANAHELTTALFERADGPYTPEFFRVAHRRKMLSTPPRVVAETLVNIWLGPLQFGRLAEAEAYVSRRSHPSLTILSGRHADVADWATERRKDGDEVLYLPLAHWVHQEAPNVVNAAIDAWIERQSGF